MSLTPCFGARITYQLNELVHTSLLWDIVSEFSLKETSTKKNELEEFRTLGQALLD